MKGLAALALAFLLVSCGSVTSQPSTLQRLDTAGSILRAVSTGATRVSDDWSRLATSVEKGNVRAVHRQARVLLVDSSQLMSRAGKAGAYLRGLRARRVGGGPRRYINDLVNALSAQWWEAREATWTARLVRRDPELRQGNDATTLARVERLSRRSATQAVTWVAAAQTLRRRDARQFRYRPLTATRTKESTP